MQSGPGWASGTCLAVVAGSIPACPFFLYRVFPVLTGYEPLIRHAFVQRGAHCDVTSFRFRPHLLWRTCGVIPDSTFHIPSHKDLHLRSTFEWMCGCLVPIRAPDRRISVPLVEEGGRCQSGGYVSLPHTCAHEWGVRLHRQYGGC